MRIVHLSDIHLWRLKIHPLDLLNKRSVGFVNLLRGRARKFRLGRLGDVVRHALDLAPDHFLITGDLTTTALPAEFRDAREALAPLLIDREKVTVLPGNHDRYTRESVRKRSFEAAFGAFAPRVEYPWLRPLDAETAILGLDPTRAHLTATGFLPPSQLAEARQLVENHRPRRLIVACHYPIEVPERYARAARQKRLVNVGILREWLATLGPHLYCCGHVHAAWAFRPQSLPDQLCLNSGAPLLHDPSGFNFPGMMEIDLQGDDVRATHHAWTGARWETFPRADDRAFFR